MESSVEEYRKRAAAALAAAEGEPLQNAQLKHLTAAQHWTALADQLDLIAKRKVENPARAAGMLFRRD